MAIMGVTFFFVALTIWDHKSKFSYLYKVLVWKNCNSNVSLSKLNAEPSVPTQYRHITLSFREDIVKAIFFLTKSVSRETNPRGALVWIRIHRASNTQEKGLYFSQKHHGLPLDFKYRKSECLHWWLLIKHLLWVIPVGGVKILRTFP